MRPIVYYGNLLLSGTLSGTNNSTTNPVRQVADGSINLGYILASDQSPTLQSGSVYVILVSSQAPLGISIPKGLLQSGHTLKLQSMSDPVSEAGLVTALTTTFTAQTEFYLAQISGLAAAAVWRVLISGVSGLVPARTHEIQLFTHQFEFGEVQVGIDRGHVRQFSRIAIPGGQPFVRREGPKLERSPYRLFSVVSAQLGFTEENLTNGDGLVDFIDAIDGGDAFTLTDDLARSYWAELLDAEPSQSDVAGVSEWTLTFQEIKVE